MNDTGALEKIVDEVIAANPDNVAQFRAGKDKAFNALVGQAMKASKGKANPAQVNELLRKKLGAVDAALGSAPRRRRRSPRRWPRPRRAAAHSCLSRASSSSKRALMRSFSASWLATKRCCASMCCSLSSTWRFSLRRHLGRVALVELQLRVQASCAPPPARRRACCAAAIASSASSSAGGALLVVRGPVGVARQQARSRRFSSASRLRSSAALRALVLLGGALLGGQRRADPALARCRSRLSTCCSRSSALGDRAVGGEACGPWRRRRCRCLARRPAPSRPRQQQARSDDAAQSNSGTLRPHSTP